MKEIIVVRGGGDLATGVVQAFYRAGYQVLILETRYPTAIRRSVSLCEAVYNGEMQVEDMTCEKIEDVSQIQDCYNRDVIPLLVDTHAACLKLIKPAAVIDAIIAKKNLGTNKSMAPVTIALGPGFEASVDVEIVIETMRGHNLGRLIMDGCAIPNTNVPGEIGGKSAERVIHAPNSGVIKHIHRLGDVIEKDAVIFEVGGTSVLAPFTGLLRGLIRSEVTVKKGMKIADIDPRVDVDWHTISDKARALGNSALSAYLYQKRI